MNAIRMIAIASTPVSGAQRSQRPVPMVTPSSRWHRGFHSERANPGRRAESGPDGAGSARLWARNADFLPTLVRIPGLNGVPGCPASKVDMRRFPLALAGATLLAAGIGLHAANGSTPASSTLTVPSGPGKAAHVHYTGTIPPGANAAGDCSAEPSNLSD